MTVVAVSSPPRPAVRSRGRRERRIPLPSAAAAHGRQGRHRAGRVLGVKFRKIVDVQRDHAEAIDPLPERMARGEIQREQHVLPGVRFAVDAYVNFARTKPWPVAVASSLTELFAPDLMAQRLAAFEKHYTWVHSPGLDYFRRRLTQAPQDSEEGLRLTLAYCDTLALQEEAIKALSFKCDVLWTMLDAIEAAYGER